MSTRATGLIVLAVVVGICALFWDDVIAPLLPFGGEDTSYDGVGDPSFLEDDGERDASSPTLRALGNKRAARKREDGDVRSEASADRPAGKPSEARFRGRVVDAGGAPASGVRIRLVGPNGTFEVTTGPDGSFDRIVPPGRYAATFEGDGSGALAVKSILVDAAGGAGTGEVPAFELAAASALDVRVLRLDGAPKPGKPPEVQPVRDAVVIVTDLETESLRQEATTGAQGVAVFEGLVPGKHRVEVRIEDGLALLHTAETFAEKRETIDVRAPEKFKLTGTVRIGAEGPGVGGAHIELSVASALSDAHYRMDFKSAYDGSFDVQVPKGRLESLAVKADGFAPWPSAARYWSVMAAVQKLMAKTSVKLDIALEAGLEVRGALLDEEQQPVPEILLRIVTPRGEDLRVSTDPNGMYTIVGLAPGKHRLYVESPGWYIMRWRDRHLEVEAGMTHTYEHPDIVLIPARTLTGRIRDALGAPVAGARIWLVSGETDLPRQREAGGWFETFSDSNGDWVIRDIPPGKIVTVRAAFGGREAVPVPVAWTREASLSVDLSLVPTGTLQGRLVDADTGEGIAGVDVVLDPTKRDGRTVVRVRTDAEGVFVVDTLIPGTWLVRPLSSDHLKSRATEVIVGTMTPAEVSIALDPGVIFAGVCVDAGGEPLPWVKLYVRGKVTDGPAIVQRALNAEADGTFHAGGLRPGTYTLQAMLEGYTTTYVKDLRATDQRMRVVLKKP